MKKFTSLLIALSIITVVSCGGSSGSGGGGGTTTSRTAAIYELTIAGTPFNGTLEELVDFMTGAGCGDGTTFGFELTGDCTNGGTWTFKGTVTCSLTTTLNILSMTDSTLELTNCSETVTTVDTDGDGNADTTAVTLNGLIDEYSFDDNTIFSADMSADPPVITLDGGALAVYSGMLLTGDIGASITFVQQSTFTDYNVNTGVGLTCASNDVSVIESGSQTFCEIQTDCTCE